MTSKEIYENELAKRKKIDSNVINLLHSLKFWQKHYTIREFRELYCKGYDRSYAYRLIAKAGIKTRKTKMGGQLIPMSEIPKIFE